MKRKIVIGLGLYALILALGAAYVLKTIHDRSKKLDHLLMLHQVEILREHYLIQIGQVQRGLTLQETSHAPEFDQFVSSVARMEGIIGACFGCHHEPPVLERIRAMRIQTAAYEQGLSRVITMHAGPARMQRERDRAFHAGEELIGQVRDMIASTALRLEESTRRTLREIEDTRYLLYGLVAVGPVVSAGLAWILVAGLTTPLGVLLRSTRKLQQGDLDHRVTGLKHEFGELADAINEMAASLKEQVQKMQRTEQMAVVGELSAGLVHEIKNPLAGIKVAMQVLADEAELSDEDRLVVNKVGGEVTQLEGLMKSFLEYARPGKPRPEPMSVNNLLGTTLAFYAGRRRGTNGGKGVEVVRQFGDVPEVTADPMQLQQVFVNLVLNAMDAMPEGGKLRVRTGLEDGSGMIRIDIADGGKGIDPRNMNRIFEPFFTTKHGGTGLGLAVSRQLVEQHGGSLSVAAAPGGGTVFTILLPVGGAA